MCWGFHAVNVWLPGGDSWLEPGAEEVEGSVSTQPRGVGNPLSKEQTGFGSVGTNLPTSGQDFKRILEMGLLHSWPCVLSSCVPTLPQHTN